MDELENIEKFLKDLKFKKQTFGGVSESDALSKIQKLSDLYDKAFKIQQVKYEALIDEKDKELRQLRENSNE